jgi:hypothetical protein
MAIYLCPTPNYRRSLQPSKENIQNFRIRIRIANPDPDKDPVTTLNPDPDPDPQNCLRVYAKPIISPHKRTTYLGASLGFRGKVSVHPGPHLKVQHAGLRVTYPGQALIS